MGCVSKEKVTDYEIEQVEKCLNIKLPNDFIECVKEYDGGYPRPKIFDIPGQDENVFNDLMTFHIEDEYSIVKNYEDVKEELLDNVYPFANDPFGISYALTIVTIPHHQQSYFGIMKKRDMEKAIHPVCSTFTELLDSLRDFEEEEN
ncbi:SMI1/KNR4 family protein [Bacillus paranthracis]